MCYVSDSNTRDGESPSHGRGDGIEPSVWVTRTRRDTLKGILGMGTGVALFGNAGLGSTSTDGTTEYDNLCFTPAAVLAERIRTDELSSEHLVEPFLDRIERRDDDINACVALTPDRARKAAHEADKAVERGRISVRCTAFRSRTRTPTRSRGYDTPTARFCSRIASPRRTSKRAYRSSSMRGRSSSAP